MPHPQRPSSAGVRLTPLRRVSAVHEVRDDAAERVLANAHAQSREATERLVRLARARREHVAERGRARALPAEHDALDRETYRCAVRDALASLLGEISLWVQSRTAPTREDGVLAWLVRLPAAVRDNTACAHSFSLEDADVVWLLRKAAATLSVLLADEDAQRAHAVRCGVHAEEEGGYLERVGCLRSSRAPPACSDWLGAFLVARVLPADVADSLLALFTYTANCRSRASVDGWELSEDDEWTDLPPPRAPAVHGPNASPWAVMNWTLRTAHDPAQQETVCAAAAESARVFTVLRDWLDAALWVLPKERDVVFRGVDVPGLSYRYALGYPVVFPPFTSTSTQGEEAREFARQDGTFFVIRSHSAARIDFVSFVPSQAEKLLPSFSCFSVLQKASNTVLRMLECPYDIVSLAEDGDDACTDEEAVEAYARSVRQTRFIYARYLRDAYVEGRVAPLPPPCDATTPLFTCLDGWLAGGGHLLLLGTGGSGKTSATLAAHCALAADDAAAPVFVPLPTVSGLFEDGALDRHLGSLLCLTPAQMTELGRTRTLVLLLESLDEVPIPPGADVRNGILGLLERNPFAASARVLISCRDEFLIAHDTQPFEVFGWAGQYVYVQPFSADDVAAFVEKQCARLRFSPRATEQKQAAIRRLGLSMRESICNPCVLHMACRVDDAALAGVLEDAGGRVAAARVYELYVRQAMGGSDVGLRGMESVALAMLSRNTWHFTVGDVARAFAAVGVSGDAFRREYLPRIPRRVESDADDEGVFAWWHKSIGEYLAARAFWASPSTALAAVSRPFSLDAPAVLAFFASMATESPRARDAACGGALVPAVLRSRDSAEERVLAAASNAQALVCASGHLLHTYDLSSIRIEAANLVGARFSHTSLRGAVFSGCLLHRANFDYADVRGASFPKSWCEHALPPFIGHTESVSSVAYSPNGMLVASASDDRTVRVWDAARGTQVLQLAGHTDQVLGVAFSPDGRVLASGSTDRTVRLWHLPTNRQVAVLEGHFNGVQGVAFSPDGALVASGSYDRSAVLWDVASGRAVRTLSGHTDGVLGVCFSPDGRYVASASTDKTARLWGVADVEDVRVLAGHSRWVRCAAFSPDGALVATGSADESVRLWNVAAAVAVRVLEGHFGSVLCVCFSPDGKLLASGSFDRTLRLWDASTGREVRALDAPDAVRGVSFAPDGKCLAGAVEDATVRVWDVVSGRDVRPQEGHGDCVNTIGFSTDGALVVTSSNDKTARLWDAAKGVELRAFRGHTFSVLAAAMSGDGTRLATGSFDKTVRLWDAHAGNALHRLEGHSLHVTCVCFSSDGALLASASVDKTVRLWEVSSGAAVRTLEGHERAVTALQFLRSGALVSGGEDSAVRVWNVATGEASRIIEQPHAVLGLSVSASEGLLACGVANSVASVWDFASGKLRLSLEGHKGRVTCVAFSADERLLATGSADATVRVWLLSTGATAVVVGGHVAWVTGVCFSPTDASVLASCSLDKSVHVYDIGDVTESASDASMAVATSAVLGCRLARMVIGRTLKISAIECVGPPSQAEGTSAALYASLCTQQETN